MAPKQNNNKTKADKTSCKINETNKGKRNRSPGVRVINGRIYDPQYGICCHQCRQKTLEFSLKCKNRTEDKQCSCYFCHICLLHRYGEKAEEAVLGDWKCPRCRGICNCSICRKKKGCCPIGRITSAAKASGFTSVFDMLQSNDSEKDLPIASIKRCKNGRISAGENGRKLNLEVVQLGKKMETCDSRKDEKGENLSEEYIYEDKPARKEDLCIKDRCGQSRKRKTTMIDPKEKSNGRNKKRNADMVKTISSEDETEERASVKDEGENKILDMKDLEEECKKENKNQDNNNNVVAIVMTEEGSKQVDGFGKNQYNSEKLEDQGYDVGTADPQGVVGLTKVAKMNKNKMGKDTKKQNKLKKEPNICTTSPSLACSPAKRNKSPGVRVIHGRIYDSQNGKCCHQCRQKTLDFSVKCKNQTEDKQCSSYYCHTCLSIRYGEKAEEMAALDDWKCPKCRGICNCSICRKKNGRCPTGRIMSAAKARGFASVSDMLQSNKYEKDVNVVLTGKHGKGNGSTGKGSSMCKYKSNGQDKRDRIPGAKRSAKNTASKKDTRTISISAAGSAKDLFSSKKGAARASNRRILDEEKDRKLNLEVVYLAKKMENCESRKNENRGNLSEGEISVDNSTTKEHVCIKVTSGKCKRRNTTGNDETAEIVTSEDETEGQESCRDDGDQSENKTSVMKDLKEKCEMKNEQEDNIVVAIVMNEDKGNQVDGFGMNQYNSEKVQGEGYDMVTSMPQGVELTKVAEINFAAEDIGYALQFLEFCEAFKKVLGIKNGQPESLLRELASGHCSYYVEDSSIVGFHIKLLSMMQNSLREENNSLDCDCTRSWLQALSRYISDSWYQTKELLTDQIELVCKSYGELSSSKKLRLLTYLCDEALGSVELRNWMDKKNLEYDEEVRIRKENGRKKEREVKMKLQNELARVVLANNGVPLSVSEHQDLVSKIKAEAAHTLADLVTKKNQKSDAIRSEPMFLDVNGCKFWKLRGHSREKTILLQDISSGERWFSYSMKEEAIIENYILRQLRK